jgi:hypothetical protein
MDDNQATLPWELLDGDHFVIMRLRPTASNGRPAVYIAEDDPFAGIAISRVEVLDDLIGRLRRAREWLKEQGG